MTLVLAWFVETCAIPSPTPGSRAAGQQGRAGCPPPHSEFPTNSRRLLSRCTFLQCGLTNAVMQQACRLGRIARSICGARGLLHGHGEVSFFGRRQTVYCSVGISLTYLSGDITEMSVQFSTFPPAESRILPHTSFPFILGSLLGRSKSK